MGKPVATGLFVGIDGVINQRLDVKDFRTRTAALELSARKPLLFDGQKFIQSVFAQLERNWTAVLSPSTKPPSRQNFRWHFPRCSIALHNASPEVTLERAFVNACARAKRDDWSNQIPVISGLAGPRAYKRCAIDLVHREPSGGFEFVELKASKAATPLSASIEVLLYGLLWLLSRRDRHILGYSSNAILDASILQLTVLAPASYFVPFQPTHLPAEINAGLLTFGKQFGVKMGFREMAFPNSFSWPGLADDNTLLDWLDQRALT